MISSEEAVAVALDVARTGLDRGEMPIGAAIFSGDALLAHAYTQEQRQGRRIVHADLLAMEEADRALGFARPDEPLTLAVNLEPCMMCFGAAITLGVDRVVYSLESPNDGAVELLKAWNPPVEQPFFRRPAQVAGGILREESRALFRRYAQGDGPKSMRSWASGLAQG